MNDVLIWSGVLLAAAVAARRRLRSEHVMARAPGTWLGIVLQAVAFSGVWIGRKWVFWGAPGWVPAELGWLAPALCVLSVAMAAWSIWTLGRNWSVAARVAESHELITTGPYRVVRHPIYTAMFGVLIAMGLSLSTPAATLAASAVFVIGTSIRVWFEERLLRGYFGEEFARYRETVPAFIPFLRLRKGAPEQL